MFFHILGGYLSQSRPKNTILGRFAIFLGSSNPPTPAGVRRFRLNKPALRSAAFGGLPSLPPGVHWGNQNGSKNRCKIVDFQVEILPLLRFMQNGTAPGTKMPRVGRIFGCIFWIYVAFGPKKLDFCFQQ